jgi:hypothetical protein
VTSKAAVVGLTRALSTELGPENIRIGVDPPVGMVELREELDGRFVRGFGGDTLNAAVYLARLGVSVDYITALGDDTSSLEMAAAWRAEGGHGAGRSLQRPDAWPPYHTRKIHYRVLTMSSRLTLSNGVTQLL